MKTVVVNDASCLIDLHKGRLLSVMLTLPYRFAVPLPIRHAEALDLTDRDWSLLEDGGLVTIDLLPKQVAEAVAIKATYPKLSANDCFCLVSTRCQDRGILLTGDRLLRRVATLNGLRVHGVLWIVDELRLAGTCGDHVLTGALERWRGDRAVFLPRREIDIRLHGSSSFGIDQDRPREQGPD